MTRQQQQMTTSLINNFSINNIICCPLKSLVLSKLPQLSLWKNTSSLLIRENGSISMVINSRKVNVLVFCFLNIFRWSVGELVGKSIIYLCRIDFLTKLFYIMCRCVGAYGTFETVQRQFFDNHLSHQIRFSRQQKALQYSFYLKKNCRFDLFISFNTYKLL